MKAQELRIGNYLRQDLGRDGLEMIKVESICYDDITECYLINQEEINAFDSYALNEQWLINFGFNKHESLLIDSFDLKIGHNKQLSFSICNDKGKVEFYGYLREWEGDIKTGDTDIVCFSRDIKHVHQLQNLYYALTGEELTLK